jgi:hypothetical protein
MFGGSDRIVELDLGCVPAAGVSEAVLVQTEYSVLLTFNAMRPGVGGKWEEAGTALAEFPGCLLTRFGYPNDEARFEIPRYAGVSYGLYEVLGCSWLEDVNRQNRSSFPRHGGWAARHFLFSFHDSTFECLASDVRLTVLNESSPASPAGSSVSEPPGGVGGTPLLTEADIAAFRARPECFAACGGWAWAPRPRPSTGAGGSPSRALDTPRRGRPLVRGGGGG